MQRESVSEVLVCEIAVLRRLIAEHCPYDVLAHQAASVQLSAARINLMAIEAVQEIRLGKGQQNSHAARLARRIKEMPPAG